MRAKIWGILGIILGLILPGNSFNYGFPQESVFPLGTVGKCEIVIFRLCEFCLRRKMKSGTGIWKRDKGVQIRDTRIQVVKVVNERGKCQKSVGCHKRSLTLNRIINVKSLSFSVNYGGITQTGCDFIAVYSCKQSL